MMSQAKQLESKSFSDVSETLEPQNKQPYSYFFERGKELLAKGLIAESLDVYKEAIEYHHDYPFSYFVLGNAYEKGGDRLQGLESYRKALEINSINHNLRLKQPSKKSRYSILNERQFYSLSNTIVNLSIACNQTQDLSASLAQISNHINDVAFCLTTTRKLLKLEKYDEAIAFLTKAQELSKFDADFSQQQELEYLWVSVNQAKQNQVLLQDRDYKIISLGYDCLPRTVATLWGLKPRKSAGELTCPFDLALHPYESIVEALNTDFYNYLNPDFLISFQVVKAYDENEKFTCVKNTRYNCLFSHERAEQFRINNFAKLIALYRRRIHNFYRYINSSPVLFLIHSRKNINLDPLIQILLHKFPNLKFKVMLLVSGTKAISPKINDGLAMTYNIPCPSNYRWPTTSARRITYEKTISEAIKETIINNF
ncbi:hypothetical protein IQ255_05475 [Pleurocapsales cyanobacterium LEGE 10410]|nr:hypothetical protein [Pleurocapsales cyanobacterium LEGE 10410]